MVSGSTGLQGYIAAIAWLSDKVAGAVLAILLGRVHVRKQEEILQKPNGNSFQIHDTLLILINSLIGVIAVEIDFIKISSK